MILRRWIVEWLQDSVAAPVIDGIEWVFRSLFGGVIGAYQAAEENVTTSPETIDLLLSAGLTAVYVAGVIAIVFFGLNTATWFKKQLTGVGFETRTKAGVAIGIWVVLTAIDTLMRGRLLVHEMTYENAEWISVTRQLLTGSVDVEVGTEVVAFGFFPDPNIEAFAMAVLALVVLSKLAYQQVPAVDSPITLFSWSLGAMISGYVALPYFGIEILPISLRPVFIGHVLFAWLIFGTMLAMILGKVYHNSVDFIKGEFGVSPRPDPIKYARDGTVMLAFFLSLISVSYTAVIALLAWFSYKVAMDKDVLKEVFGSPSVGSSSRGTTSMPSSVDCEPENWNEEQGICEIGD